MLTALYEIKKCIKINTNLFNRNNMKIKIITLLTVFTIGCIHSQTPESLDFGFTTYNVNTAFTTIALDSINNRVWAGTNQNGVFNIEIGGETIPPIFSTFTGSAADGPDLSNIRITSMAGDGLGNIWIGHQGTSFNGIQGGLEKINGTAISHYSADRNFIGISFYEREGLATRRLTSVTVDKNNKVWVAQKYHDLTVTGTGGGYYLTPGALSYKSANAQIFTTKGGWFPGLLNGQPAELPYPAWTKNPPPVRNAQSRTMDAISVDNSQVWVGVRGYSIRDDDDTDRTDDTHYENNLYVEPRVLVYDLNANFMNLGSVPTYRGFSYEDMRFPPGGIINGICASNSSENSGNNNNKGTWVTNSFTGRGFSVYNGNSWTYMDPNNVEVQKIIPSGTRFNANAMWKNEYGNVFMGTTNGLLVYDGRNPINEAASYTLYSKTDIIPGSPYVVIDSNMSSNNIKGGVSNKGEQWIATDNGIMRVKIGHIEYKEEVGLCPNNWRERTNFSDDLSINQCLLSQAQSTNPVVMEVETAVATPDNTYHRYQIETTIYDPNGSTANRYATVENIFHMLKEHSKFQAIIPYDMPTEILGDEFLQDITPEHVKLFEDKSNEQTSRIPTVQSIMDLSGLTGYDIKNNTWRANSGLIINFNPWQLLNRKIYFNRQVAVNPEKSIHESQTYLLYNTPEASEVRMLFKKYYTNGPLWTNSISVNENCQGLGLESVPYDPVIMHIDDTNYTIINYTKEGHYFHPGKITRTVIRDKDTGEIYIRTIGEGLHFCKGNLGVFSGKLNTMMGVILFKNVDLRLKDAFEALEN